MEKLLVNVDGHSQGNPGEAAIGVVMTDGDGNVVEEISKPIGRATNNVAEYKALIEASKAALEYNPKRVIFFTDSQLVANQINGLYRVRRPHLDNLNQTAMDLLNKLPSWQVRYVERTANWKAHRLAQKALLEREPGESAGLFERIRSKFEKLSDADKRKVLDYINRLLEEGRH